MAVAEYGTTNITFQSTDTWANNVDGNDNISVSGSNGWARDIADDPGATNLSVNSELRSNKLFYGNVVTKTNITAQVTLPYTSGTVSAGSSLAIKNNSFNDNTTVRLVASPTYPYVFQKWTSDTGGSTTISTNATLTTTVSAGKYSNGTEVMTVDSSGVITSGTLC